MAKTISIDMREFEFDAGETVLSVAKRNGIFIPTLCYHEALKPYGACRLCLVEVLEGDKPGLHASCLLSAKQGLVVLTVSDLVLKVRGVLIQLLLKRYPKEKSLMDIAKACGIEDSISTLTGEHQEKACLLCGRCVRACEEMGRSVIGFVSRGSERAVDAPIGSHKECLGCRACENVCPTGVVRFSLHDGVIKNDLWDITVDMAVCPICGRSFATVPLIDKVKTELEALSEAISMCPACRRAELLKRICV